MMTLKIIRITYPEAVFINGVYFRTPVTFEYFDDEAIEHIKNECMQKGYRYEISVIGEETKQQLVSTKQQVVSEDVPRERSNC